MKRHKRVWTEEQKAAAAERMKHARAVRMSKISAKKDSVSSWHPENDHAVAVEEKPVIREVSPEVQAVIDSMDSERKVKMEMMRARQIAELSQTKEGREALARLEESKHPSSGDVPPMRRPGSYELSIIVRNDGTMVSQFGPCLCGAGKRQWHKICLEAESETMK